MAKEGSIPVERFQTGVRLEKRILKVLKATAEMTELSLGQLIEGLSLHAFHGKDPFYPETRKKIQQLLEVYGLKYGVDDYEKFIEKDLGCGDNFHKLSGRECN